jgi:alcohol dehydrogenase (cytochrome c)
MLRRIVFGAVLFGVFAVPVLTQTIDELLSDGKNTENVLTQSLGYDRKSYSPLKQINKTNIKRLVPIWNSSLMNDQGELAAPTIYNGRDVRRERQMDVAIDVETGRQIWRTPTEIESGITRAAFNRGAATIYKGKIFRITIDNHVLAIDMKTGKELWNQKFADAKDGYYSTAAPIVANGVLISGVAGGESTTRGFLDGWDPDTGKNSGGDTPFPPQASLARKPGRKTATHGRRAGAPRGAPVPTIRSSIWSIGAQAMPSRTIRGLARIWIASSPIASLPFGRRPVKSSAIFNTRPTTCTTSMQPTNRCSPIFRSADSFGR